MASKKKKISPKRRRPLTKKTTKQSANRKRKRKGYRSTIPKRKTTRKKSLRGKKKLGKKKSVRKAAPKRVTRKRSKVVKKKASAASKQGWAKRKLKNLGIDDLGIVEYKETNFTHHHFRINDLDNIQFAFDYALTKYNHGRRLLVYLTAIGSNEDGERVGCSTNWFLANDPRTPDRILSVLNRKMASAQTTSSPIMIQEYILKFTYERE